MRACSKTAWPPRLVTVPGLHGSEGAHWQTWLERQFPRSLRVEQDDWDAPDLAGWAHSVRALLERERGPFVLAAHSFGCLAAAHALAHWPHAGDVAGVLLVAPASPLKFTFAGAFDARRLPVPSIVIGSETDRGCRSATPARSRSARQRVRQSRRRGPHQHRGRLRAVAAREVFRRHARALRGAAALSRGGGRVRCRRRRRGAGARGLTTLGQARRRFSQAG